MAIHADPPGSPTGENAACENAPRAFGAGAPARTHARTHTHTRARAVVRDLRSCERCHTPLEAKHVLWGKVRQQQPKLCASQQQITPTGVVTTTAAAAAAAAGPGRALALQCRAVGLGLAGDQVQKRQLALMPSRRVAGGGRRLSHRGAGLQQVPLTGRFKGAGPHVKPCTKPSLVTH